MVGTYISLYRLGNNYRLKQIPSPFKLPAFVVDNHHYLNNSDSKFNIINKALVAWHINYLKSPNSLIFFFGIVISILLSPKAKLIKFPFSGKPHRELNGLCANRTFH